MRIKAILGTIVLILLLGVAGKVENSGESLSDHSTVKPSPVCYEDEPCWNCHTMGNRICGGPTPNLKVSY